ncbi:hypothetical protein KKA14_20725 [bacterium]|nr:hypothetical protein [bacterium]
MKRNILKKQHIVVLSIIIIGLISGSYIYWSDNSGTVSLPDHVIPISQEVTVSYLVKIPKGYLMFDTGYEADFEKFLSGIEEKKIDLGTTTIVPSHGKPFSSQKLRENLHKYSHGDLVRFFSSLP